ncbi:hypothetical protein ILUMI_09916 [Ignelater luminosus]|uniref:Uncharacterized protein n=1 Tax=Ignelater luminosus TaxID=2038154 RepID=A0A8K0CYU8_IGNLU|nr:hypothetical protein ILUMI_09916 [Ignelater luminosus]
MSSKTKRILDICNYEDNQPKKLDKEAENVNNCLEENDEFDVLAMPRESDYQEVNEDENNQDISRSPSDLSNETLYVDKENEPNKVYLRKPTKTNCTFGINIRKIDREKRMKGKAYLGYRRPANPTNAFHDTE